MEYIDSGENVQPPVPPVMERLLDLELPVAVGLGSAILSLKDVLKIKPGSCIELQKEAGEEAELLVHGMPVARGEIVLVKENYGFRVKHINTRGLEPLLRDSQT
jgi:flagellar motor switch protein FliN/FliY